MTLFNILFEINEKSLSEQFNSASFYLRLVVFTLVGILFLGYVNWKAKKKADNKKH